MPELPEVETICRGLKPLLEGRLLVRVQARRPDLRFALPADFGQRLTGQTVSHITRRGKYGLIHLAAGDCLIFHLGMSGRIRIAQAGAADATPGKHDHIVIETDQGVTLMLNDPRRFGMMDIARSGQAQAHAWLRGLGPEPLSNGFSGPVLAAGLKGRNTSMKAALLDQHVVAGLGNIYVCEALHEAGISPRRRAASLAVTRAERLAAAIVSVLNRAIAAGGSSLRDYAQVDGALGYFQTGFKVYDRAGQPCPAPGCGRPVKRIVQAGRSTFYCSACQK